MSTYSAGEARLSVVPDLSGFARKLEADMRKVRAEFALHVTADTGQAAADINRFREQQQRNGINVGVDVALAQADAHMAAWRLRQRADTVTVPVDVDTGSARRQVESLSKLVGGGSLGGALKWNAGALGVGSLPAVATALATVASAVQQLSQAGLALPGVFAGIGASAGTAMLGFSGMKDALEAVNKAADGTPESLAKADEALKALAPNAREVVRTVAGLKPEFEGLKSTVAQNMFEGVSDSIKSLAAADLPVLQKGLGGIATAWNGTLKQLAASSGSEQSQGILDRILGNTAEAQTRFTQAIDPLVHGIGTLTAAGTDVVPRLADGVGKIAERFDKFITAADGDGRLDKWINDGVTGLGHLGETFLNLGKSITAITQAAGGGEGLLGTLEAGTTKLQEFLNSAQGQDMLKRFFQEGRDQLEKWWPILQNIAGMLPSVFEGAKQWTDALLPPLQTITGLLAEHPDLIQAVATAFVAWKSIQGVSSLLTSLTNVATSLTGLPGQANTAAAGINKALALIVVPEIGKQLNDQIQQWLKDNHPDLYEANNSYTPDQLGKNAREWVDRNLLPNLSQSPPGGGVPQAQLQAPSGSRESGGVPTTVDGLPATQATAPSGTRESGGLPENIRPPGFDRGGPTPSGRGNGPTGGWISELHGDEWVLPAHVRAAVGDKALWALTSGRSFAGGGYIDRYGNPITPGPSPGGPASVAPAPGGGGAASLFGSFLSGLGGVGSNVAGLVQGLGGLGGDGGIPGLQTQHGSGTQTPATPSLFDRAANIPGLIGLFGSLVSSNPADALTNWGSQTAQWLGNFTAKTAGGFATALWMGNGTDGGLLGALGLQNSILSPNNRWNQDAQRIGQFALGQNGPIGTLMGGQDSSITGRSKKAPTDKQIRDGQQKITRADQKVAEIQQRIAELKPGAKQSQRTALQNQLANAQQEAQDARDDYATLIGGSSGSPLGASPSSFASSAASASSNGVGGSLLSGIGGKGAERWRPVVRQALSTYGPRYGITNYQAWEDAMVLQLNTESGGNPNAYNGNDSNGRGGRQVVQGIGQFLRSTFDANNITGGDYLDPVAQISAMIPYVANKYGMDANGAPLQIGRGVGYSYGGAARGPGGPRDDQIPAWLSNGEHVLSAADVNAMGGQDNVYAFRNALHFADAGQVIVPPRPTPPPVDRTPIRQITPRPAASQPRSAAPSTAAPGQASVAPSAPAAPQAPTAPQSQRPASVAPVAPGPASSSSDAYSHNISAIDTGIDSGFAALGQAASTAIGVAAGLGGSAGVPGVGALGGLGSYAAGLAQQGGKIAKNIANVGSSFLVGSVPGSFGTTDNAYGATLRPVQNVPQTAEYYGGSKTINMYGIDGRRIVDDLRLMGQQEAQAQLAPWSGV